MKQIAQNLKTGKITIEDVPEPTPREGCIVVKNSFSLISSGTERSKVEMGEKNIIQKALAKPELIKEVIKKIRQEGFMSTYNKVQHRLDSFTPLGYSCAGTVVAVADKVKGFSVGQRVTCAGAEYAHHAETVCVPVNLAAKIPDNVGLDEAAFSTLGAIALQGIRQARINLADNVCVIGLGLLGQITIQLLNASGANAFGIDPDKDKVILSEKSGAKKSITRDSDIEQFAHDFTGEFGFDAVIITAATKDNDPLVVAGKITRDRGRVVIVGDVKIDIPRKFYYGKELEIIMSRSYGPGRYDTLYEEKGIDYPIGYVRWTQKRNIETVLDLLSKEKLDFLSLISHRIPIQKGLEAYDIVSGKTDEPHMGVVIEYPEKSEIKEKVFTKTPQASTIKTSDINVGFIGAGNFAKGTLLPHLRKMDVALRGVSTSNPLNAKSVAKRFGFDYCASSAEQIIDDKDINTIFIATRHNSHAKYVVEGLKKGKQIFVEKPLAINKEELEEIIKTYESLDKKPQLFVGFNRRFSPLSAAIKKEFEDAATPLMINYRVNAGFISADSWVQDDDIGGGRIVGEMCHFIDLVNYLTGSRPSKVGIELLDKGKSEDNICLNIKFRNGSVANIVYTASGDSALEKEYLEVFGANKTFVNHNFLYGTLYKGNRAKKVRISSKGYTQELAAFLDSIKTAKAAMDFDDIVLTTSLTFKVKEKAREGGGQIVL